MRISEIMVTIGNSKEQVTKEMFENSLHSGSEWNVIIGYKHGQGLSSHVTYPIEKHFYSAKELAEYLIENGIKSPIRSSWTNNPISDDVKEKIVAMYNEIYCNE